MTHLEHSRVRHGAASCGMLSTRRGPTGRGPTGDRGEHGIVVDLGALLVRDRSLAGRRPDGVPMLVAGAVTAGEFDGALMDREAGAVPLQLFVLGAVFAVLAVLSDSVWALTAGTARAWFGRDPRRLAGITAGGGAMMIGLGGLLVATGSER